jgi:Ribbon-helix-helix protein, copG family
MVKKPEKGRKMQAQLMVRVDQEMVEAIDRARRTEWQDVPTRGEAIRRLLAKALGRPAKARKGDRE